MGLSIRNIGRIESADIELDGITVVAGNNASGKSTVSKALYAVLDSFCDLRGKARSQRTRSMNKTLRSWLGKSEDYNWLEVQEMVALRKKMRMIFLKKALKREDFFEKIKVIMDCYEIEDWDNGSVENLYEEYVKFQKNDLNYYMTFSTQMTMDKIFYQQANTIGQKKSGIIEYATGISRLYLEIVENKVKEIKKTKDSLVNLTPIYITTSDLMDSMGSYQKLYKAQKTGEISYINLNLLNLLMDDNPIEGMTAEEYQKIKQQSERLDAILNEIVNGDIRMEEEQLVFYDNWCHSNIEFANVASGMKVFIILKRLIQNGALLGGTVLIIDEPETNLHPEWQLKLAELLVRIYTEMGIKVYVNSHSPYFVRAVEFYADKYQALDNSRFYLMQETKEGMYTSEDVTQRLGAIYDKMAEPFNEIM